MSRHIPPITTHKILTSSLHLLPHLWITYSNHAIHPLLYAIWKSDGKHRNICRHTCAMQRWPDNDMEIKWQRKSIDLLMLHFEGIHPCTYAGTHSHTRMHTQCWGHLICIHLTTGSIAQAWHLKSMEKNLLPQVSQLWKYSFWIMHLVYVLVCNVLCIHQRVSNNQIYCIKWQTNLCILEKHQGIDLLRKTLLKIDFTREAH